MKRILLTSLFICSVFTATYSQQQLQVSHNMFNNMNVNPAYAGIDDQICATAIVRNQWMGFPGAPKSNIFSIDAPVRILHGGLGLGLVQDKLGDMTNMLAKLNYSFILKDVAGGNLGIGLAAGFLNAQYDYSKFKANELNDKSLLSTGKESGMLTDLSGGVFYKKADKLYVGLSTAQILKSEKTLGSSKYDLARHYYFTAGYYYDLSSMPITLNPSVFIKSDANSTQFDVNLLAIYNKKYWGGLSYRHTDAVSILIGGHPFNNGNLAPLKLGIAYDVTTSAIKKGSMEIMLGYCFKIEVERIPDSYRNVRNL